MNKRAESVKFVVIMCAALILIGLGFVMLSKTPTVTSKMTYSREACYSLDNGKLSVSDVAFCCSQIKKSSGCEPYVVNNINDELFVCKGDSSVVVNEETIAFCG